MQRGGLEEGDDTVRLAGVGSADRTPVLGDGKVTPREFLTDVVRPNVAEFKGEYGSVQRAFNAVASVDALAAHLYHWCVANNPAVLSNASDDSRFKGVLAGRCADFRLVRDIANAQKHVVLRRGRPVVSSGRQVSSRSLGWDGAIWDEAHWDGPPQVVVDTDHGDTRVVESLVDGAMAFLEAEMSSVGVP